MKDLDELFDVLLGNWIYRVLILLFYSQNRCIARNDFKFLNRIAFILAVNHRPGGGVTQITIETKKKHIQSNVAILENLKCKIDVESNFAGINPVSTTRVYFLKFVLLHSLFFLSNSLQ